MALSHICYTTKGDLSMKWFRWKQPRVSHHVNPDAEAKIDPDSGEEYFPGVTVLSNGEFSIKYRTVKEAKQTLQELELVKSEFSQEINEVYAEMAEVRAGRRLGRPGLDTILPSFGKLGRRGWSFPQYTLDRHEEAEALAPLEAKEAELNQKMLELDQAILAVEAYIAEESRWFGRATW